MITATVLQYPSVRSIFQRSPKQNLLGWFLSVSDAFRLRRNGGSGGPVCPRWRRCAISRSSCRAGFDSDQAVHLAACPVGARAGTSMSPAVFAASPGVRRRGQDPAIQAFLPGRFARALPAGAGLLSRARRAGRRGWGRRSARAAGPAAGQASGRGSPHLRSPGGGAARRARQAGRTARRPGGRA